MHMGVLCITKYARDKATHNLYFHLKIEPNEIFGKCRERVCGNPRPYFGALYPQVVAVNGSSFSVKRLNMLFLTGFTTRNLAY